MFNKTTNPTMSDTKTTSTDNKTEMTHVALGIYRDTKSGEWCVAEITYNPDTGSVGAFTNHPSGPYKEMAIEKFKITAVKNQIV